MVRFFDQPIKMFVLISGAIHIMLLGSLSLQFPSSIVSSQDQLISIKLLETSQPREKPPVRRTEGSKKIPTIAAKQEAKKLPETKPGGLGIGEGQGGNIATVPGGGISASGEREASRGGGMNPPSSGKGEKGFREARPLQTVRASYPLMALRMGIEADVELKIQVDAEGKVIKVTIVKSAGMGFDDEAVKAVRQFHFEPARKDGENVASQFTYIYRFRLER